MTVMMNLSSIDSTMLVEDTRGEMTNDVYDNIPTKIITALTCIFVLTIGNALWSGIIHFELYGGDPKKRSITNKARELVYSYKIMRVLSKKTIIHQFDTECI